jgi:8-oxo-dGTP pyrophosphatase MutT (NUDIX family)
MGRAGDGDGWVVCARGHRHWGRFGAAGLLLHHRDPSGRVAVLLQHRSPLSHHGGTWSLVGGARDSGESPTDTALREAGEEATICADVVHAAGILRDDHGGWAYHTVLAEASHRTPAAPVGWESTDVRWVGLDDVERLSLHPGLRRTWPLLRSAMVRLTVVVEVAGTVRAASEAGLDILLGAGLLRDRLAVLTRGGVPDDTLPSTLTRPSLGLWMPDVVLVTSEDDVEPGDEVVPNGAAGAVPVLVVTGPDGDGLVEVVREHRVQRPGSPVLVVTADPGVRARCAVLGAAATGPEWLLRQVGVS